MNKILVLAIVSILILIGLAIAFLSPQQTNTDTTKFRVIQNPVTGLSEEKAVQSFNESFVLYLALSIGAGKLHNIPFSSDIPIMEVYVDELIFNVKVNSGAVTVSRGSAQSKDIILKTTKREAVRMLKDKNYIGESFSLGNSQIKLVAGKLALLGKGYLSLYQDLTGKSAE